MNPRLNNLFISWARAKGYNKPSSEEGMRVLKAQFLLELQSKVQSRVQRTAVQLVAGAAGDATYASDPIAKMSPPTITMRDSGGLTDVTDFEHEDSDFTELVRNRAAALDEAGGDDLAAEVIHRHGVQQQVTQQAPFGRNNPPSSLGQVLGNQVIATEANANITSGLIPYGPPVELCAWQGDDIETTAVTVCFGPVGNPPNVAGNLGQAGNGDFPLGRVLFGTRGYLQKVDVDIATGCQFTINASQVRLQALLGSINSNNQLPFVGMISFGTAVHTAPVTCTQQYLGLAHNTTTSPFIAVPNFAKNVMVRRVLGTAYTVTFFTNTPTSIYAITVANGAELSAPLEIPGTCYALRITNNDNAATDTYTLTYQLGL